MDVNGVTQLATSMSQSQNGDAVDMLVLRKALKLQAESAAQLLAALPTPPAANNPPHLGQNVDLRA